MGFVNVVSEGSTEFDTLPSVDYDTLLSDESVEACHENSSIEAALRICYESTVNWNRIKEACAADEITCLESTGQEMIYEGAKLDAFIDKAKAFFQNLWKKVQEMFKKVLIQFSSWFQSDKDFLNKYKKDIQKSQNTKGDFGDKEIDVYLYQYYEGKASYDDLASVGLDSYIAKSKELKDMVDGDALKSKDLKELQETNKEFDKEKVTELLDQIRADICGTSSNAVSAAEFKKEYIDSVRGDSSKTSEKLVNMIPKAIKFLEESAKIKTALNKLLQNCKKEIDAAIKKCESARKTLNKLTQGAANDENQKAGVVHTLLGKGIDVLKSTREVLIQANGFELQCLKECSRQSKAICVKAVSYVKPKDSTNESATVGGALESINFI